MERSSSIKALAILGSIAFLVAALSIVDMFLPQPFDGVVLDPDRPEVLLISDVVPGSGADLAGVQVGDEILGIGRNILKSRRHAARLLRRFETESEVLYFLRRRGHVKSLWLRLGERRMAAPSYAYACLLGFFFFGVGLYVLLRQPAQRASRVFFLLCSFFMLFLVCRLRPASYSRLDTIVFSTGTMALVWLPASFVHFFLIFPRPLPLVSHWLAAGRGYWVRLLTALYLLPALVLLGHVAVSALLRAPLPLISGAPVVSWWVLALYLALGLGLLAVNSRHLPTQRERRGTFLVLFGSLVGLVPLLVIVVALPSFLHSDRFILWGTVPLLLFPLTFAIAIVRFQILDIRVILQKSLLYTVTTALVTGLYALGIASFNLWFSGTTISTSRWFLLFFALAIVLLFEPLRRRIQGPVDRFFFGEQTRLQKAMLDLGTALTARVDLATVVRDLVEELPRLLGVEFSALYLVEDSSLRRVAGPQELPQRLALLPVLEQHLTRRRRSVRHLEDLEGLQLRSPEMGHWIQRLRHRGVDVIGDLASPRRRIGMVLLSRKASQMDFEPAELELLGGLLSQAAVALENSLLLEERTQQAELKRELEIASEIQTRLLPADMSLGDGWDVAALCRPARDVGGDFFAQLPGATAQQRAIVYGDVSGKSVSGALMMMAAHEVLHALAMTHPDPETLLELANRRLYQLGDRSFVALGYLASCNGTGDLLYTVAGQPSPLRRTADGQVSELEPPSHRLPLGAFSQGKYSVLRTPVAPGELILAYSDGVVDTRSPAGEFFGEERLRTTLAEAPAEPSATLDYLLEALADFSQGQSPYDDLTLVALMRRQETS